MNSFFSNLSENIKNILNDETFADEILAKPTKSIQNNNKNFPEDILTCFSILAIQPTKDLQIIKKAYREQLKKIHPDTNSQNLPNSTEELEKQKKAIETLVQWLKNTTNS